MNATQLLTLAAALTPTQVQEMTYAVDWDVERPRRNYFYSPSASSQAQWEAAHAAGLVEKKPPHAGSPYWCLTPLGRQVLGVRLTAARMVYGRRWRDVVQQGGAS